MKCYVASKIKHAARWRELRDRGFPICSTWIDEEGEGQSQLPLLAERCLEEARGADFVVFYVEDEESPEGALIECGAALANRRPVFCVGDGSRLSRVFARHPYWHEAPSVEDAIRSGMALGTSEIQSKLANR